MDPQAFRVHEVEGQLSAAGMRVCLVVSRFNSFVVEPLVQGALDCLKRYGGTEATVVRVPGAWELPVTARALALSGRYDVLIALGAVIRGSTPHFDYVAGEAAKGLAAVQMQTGVPISFGVLTTDTIEQAIERAGTKAGNKGWDAAMGAIETFRVLETVRVSNG